MKRGTCNAEEDGGCEAEADPCSGWRRLVSDNVRLALLCFAAIVITLSRNIFCTSVSFVQPLVCNCGHVRLLLKKYIVIHLRVDFIFLKAEHEWSICSPRKFPQMVASSRFTTLQPSNIVTHLIHRFGLNDHRTRVEIRRTRMRVVRVEDVLVHHLWGGRGRGGREKE